MVSNDVGHIVPRIVHSVGRQRWTISWCFPLAVVRRVRRCSRCWPGNDLASGKIPCGDCVYLLTGYLDPFSPTRLCHSRLRPGHWLCLCHDRSSHRSQSVRSFNRLPRRCQVGFLRRPEREPNGGAHVLDCPDLPTDCCGWLFLLLPQGAAGPPMITTTQINSLDFIIRALFRVPWHKRTEDTVRLQLLQYTQRTLVDLSF